MYDHKPASVLQHLLLIALSLVPAGTALAWDPIRDLTGRNLTNILEDRTKNLGHQMEKLADDPVKYALHLPRSLFADACGGLINYYGGTLAGQADGHWHALPPQLVKGIQQYYSNNLSIVRYANNIRTGGGVPQTFGNLINFPYEVDLTNPQHMWTMLHELEHTTQYAGEAQTLKQCEYVGKAFGNGLEHDRIDWERAADAKADYAIDTAMQALYSMVLNSNEVLIQNDTNQMLTLYMAAAHTDAT